MRCGKQVTRGYDIVADGLAGAFKVISCTQTYTKSVQNGTKNLLEKVLQLISQSFQTSPRRDW